MNAPALVIAIPLLVAVFLAGAGGKIPRWLIDGASICAALACFVLSCCMISQARAQPITYWFGGWRPTGSAPPVGIAFLIDPIGAGLSALASLLVTGAFVFSIQYFKEIKGYFHALMLIFLAALCAFSL